MTEKKRDKPIAYCPANEVEAWELPFFIKPGMGMEEDFLMMDFHMFHMTTEEKDSLGKLVEITAQ